MLLMLCEFHQSLVPDESIVFFFSAAEIRHILICMGELVTDEEINEMIGMCDTDGDGQVSYEEFYRLAKHPDPSRPDFNSSMYVAWPLIRCVRNTYIQKWQKAGKIQYVYNVFRNISICYAGPRLWRTQTGKLQPLPSRLERLLHLRAVLRSELVVLRDLPQEALVVCR